MDPWSTIGRLAGGYLYSHYGRRKKRLPKTKGVVTSKKNKWGVPTSSVGKRNYDAFLRANPPINLLDQGGIDKRGRISDPASLSAAQRLRDASTQTEQEYERKKSDGMSIYAPGTLGVKYKPKYKTPVIKTGTARRRYVDHETVNGTNAVYTAFNDVGPLTHVCTAMAEALLIYYMRRSGDFRTKRGALESDSVVSNPTVATWARIEFQWRRVTAGAEADVYDTINHKNIASSGYLTFDQMVDVLRDVIRARMENHYELSSVRVYRAQDGDDGNQFCFIYDTDAGRHTIEYYAKAKLKIQNTTAADSTEDAHNKDNIHANPLDGLVYKFRNRTPLYAASFISGLDDTSTTNVLNDIEDQDYSGVSGVKPTALQSHGTVFNVPPPAPYTVWRNSAGRSKILIKPGFHRVLTLEEHFKGSFNSMGKKYIPNVVNSRRKAPPGGNCVLVGLKPTFRTGTNEDLQIQVEVDRYVQSLMTPRKLTSFPIANVMS